MAVGAPMPVSLKVFSGMLFVTTVWPSLVIAVLRPVARSAVSALNAVDVMVVPVTTGWPAVLIRNVPVPLKLIGFDLVG